MTLEVTLDMVLAVVALAAAREGWRKGAVRQLGSLAAVVLALLLSRWLAPAEPDLFAQWLPERLRDTLVGGYVARTGMRIAVFSATFAVCMAMVRMLRRVVHAALLGPVDRVAGMAISLFKWGLAASLALNLWFCFRPDDRHTEATLLGGRFVESVTGFAPWLWGEAKTFALIALENNNDDGDPATSTQPSSATDE